MRNTNAPNRDTGLEAKDEFRCMVHACIPLIHLTALDEQRALELISSSVETQPWGVVSWDIADGVKEHRAGNEPVAKGTFTFDTVLPELVEKSPGKHVFVLKDFHHAWTTSRAYTTRKLRNLVPLLRATNKCVVLLTPPLTAGSAVPFELEDYIVHLALPLPDETELAELFDRITSGLPTSRLPNTEAKRVLVRSALGLSSFQASLAFGRFYTDYEAFDKRGIDAIRRFREQTMRSALAGSALEVWPAGEDGSGVGGLEVLKKWIKTRSVAFSGQSEVLGLHSPRGVAFVGLPGSGKSLCVKMMSRLWRLPLLRLPMGALFGYARNVRQVVSEAILFADRYAPCILWMDELDSAVSWLGRGDVEAALHLVHPLFDWLRDANRKAFVVAETTDLSWLLPFAWREFDEVFVLDVPDAAERRQILGVHLAKCGLNLPRRFDIGQLVEASQGMTGREVEQAIHEAMYVAFEDGSREVAQEDLLEALHGVVPVSSSHHEETDRPRQWKVQGRAKSASLDRQENEPPARSLEV